MPPNGVRRFQKFRRISQNLQSGSGRGTKNPTDFFVSVCDGIFEAEPVLTPTEGRVSHQPRDQPEEMKGEDKNCFWRCCAQTKKSHLASHEVIVYLQIPPKTAQAGITQE